MVTTVAVAGQPAHKKRTLVPSFPLYPSLPLSLSICPIVLSCTFCMCLQRVFLCPITNLLFLQWREKEETWPQIHKRIPIMITGRSWTRWVIFFLFYFCFTDPCFSFPASLLPLPPPSSCIFSRCLRQMVNNNKTINIDPNRTTAPSHGHRLPMGLHWCTTQCVSCQRSTR